MLHSRTKKLIPGGQPIDHTFTGNVLHCMLRIHHFFILWSSKNPLLTLVQVLKVRPSNSYLYTCTKPTKLVSFQLHTMTFGLACLCTITLKSSVVLLQVTERAAGLNKVCPTTLWISRKGQPAIILSHIPVIVKYLFKT